AAATASMEADPRLPDGYFYRATTRLRSDPAHPDAAVDDLIRARERATSPADAARYALVREALGLAYLRGGDATRAAAEWEAALAAAPRNTVLRLRLIDLYVSR